MIVYTSRHNLKSCCDIHQHFDDGQTIVMTFLVRECYGSPKKQEF